MNPALEFPSPRDELDSGSVSELVEDGRSLVVPHTALPHRQPRHVGRHVDSHVGIDVPEGAAQLLRGLGDYGS